MDRDRGREGKRAERSEKVIGILFSTVRIPKPIPFFCFFFNLKSESLCYLITLQL